MLKEYINLVKSPEERKIFWNKIDLEVRKIGYMIMQSLNQQKGRLNGEGKIGGIMLIGINPSIRSGLKSVWEDPYGEYLRLLLDKAGLDWKKVYVTNLYKKPTPDNRPLNDAEMEEGKLELIPEITAVDPKVIIMFGKQVQGCLDPDHKGNEILQKYRMIGLSHPSFIKRYATTEQKVEFINELRSLKKYE